MKRNLAIQAEKDGKRLHPISEESKEASGSNGDIRSYEYAQNGDDYGNNSSLFGEKSE
jgi:hypothetical protein